MSRQQRPPWTADEIVEAMQCFAQRYGRAPRTADFRPGTAMQLGHAWRAEQYRAGDYPSVTSVQRRFGSWSNALRAAGFVPYGPGGYPRDGHCGQHLQHDKP